MKRWVLGTLIAAGMAPYLHAQTVSTTTLTLGQCYTLAETNYKPLKLAKDEIETSGWKLTETTRNLLPTMNVKAEETNGEADRTLGTPRFKEQSYGVQMNYSLYEGGRSWSTRKQARANYRIAQFRYRKTRQDMVYGVLEAYWNLIRVQANLDEYRRSLAEIRAIYDESRRLLQEGVLSERATLEIESQFNQAVYQADAAQADCENFAWKLADALGLQKPLGSMPAAAIPYREIPVTVEECLRLAETNNLDIAIQKEALTAAAYGAAAKRGYKWPKIDLNGFYGRSGGAYENEQLKLSEDYQVTVQLTQYFLFNTLTGSGLRQRTSPKLGQSARTELGTVSASLNLLDGYKQISDEKEAVLAFAQASYGMEKTRTTVSQEVRDAYFNYRKALAQVKNTQLDASIADKELSITRINAGSERSGLDTVAEALNKCAGAKAALNEAKAFYLISLAAMNKAVGIENKFTIEQK
jgi:outer membrane protein TolC